MSDELRATAAIEAQMARGHITKAGNRHARRLLVEAAWHYRHRPRHTATGPRSPRACHAEIRLYHRHRHLTARGKRSTIANVAVARESTLDEDLDFALAALMLGTSRSKRWRHTMTGRPGHGRSA